MDLLFRHGMTPTQRLIWLKKLSNGGGGGGGDEGDLPDGYTEVTGLEFNSRTYYRITDFPLRGSDTVTFSFSANKSCNVMGCYTTTSATTNYSLYASTSSSAKYLRYGDGTYSSYIPSESIGQRIDVVITPTGSIGMPREDTWEESDFECESDLCICNTSPGSSSAKLDGCIFGRFIVNNRLTLTPCERESDGVLGYYDKDRGIFYEPIGDNPISLGYV